MKYFFLLFLLSCSTFKEDLPPFEPEKVCSVTSLRYYNTQIKTTARKRSSPAEIEKELQKMYPEIRKCYEEELSRTKNPKLRFHLCHVTGFDEKGKQEYYQFSSVGADLTASMKYCLEDIRHKVKLGLRNVKILQPYSFQTIIKSE